MKYLLCFVLFLVALGMAGPPLWYTHALPPIPAGIAAFCIGFMCYLFDPTEFLAFSAEMRKNVTCYFKRGDAP